MKKTKSAENTFMTLSEIIIVIAIISLLATLLVSTFSGKTEEVSVITGETLETFVEDDTMGNVRDE